jgi:hypothetical protein
VHAAYLSGFPETSAKVIETARGNLMNGQGLGHELIEAFLRRRLREEAEGLLADLR